MIRFQQEHGPDFKRPWAVIVDDDGEIIYGRPDARHLIGFGPVDSYEIPVLTKDALADPSLAVGLAPRFQMGGNMFAVDLAVTSCVTWEEEAPGQKEALVNREHEMRGLLA